MKLGFSPALTLSRQNTSVMPVKPSLHQNTPVKFGRDWPKDKDKDIFQPSAQQAEAEEMQTDDELDPNNPTERENLIASILEDVEEDPHLHRELTRLRDAHPNVRAYSESNPHQFIEDLRNIAVAYANENSDAAHQQMLQLIQRANRH